MPRSVLRLAALLVLLAGPAAAHAVLMAATPADRAEVKAGQVPITLRFNSRIDAARSRVTLAQRAEPPHALPLAAAAPDLLAGTADLAPGAYVLRWQVLATDGHITRGEIRFTVVPVVDAH